MLTSHTAQNSSAYIHMHIYIQIALAIHCGPACRSSVLARIEGFISDTIASIANGGLPELELVSRSAANTHMVTDDADAAAAAAAAAAVDGSLSDLDNEDGSAHPSSGSTGMDGTQPEGADVEDIEGGGGGAEGSRWRQQQRQNGAGAGRGARRAERSVRRVRLGSRVQTKTLTRNQGQQACAVARGGWVLELGDNRM